MKIKAVQKLTLLDFPGRTACTVFTYGCNLMCPFCHNAGLVAGDGTEDYITEDEIYRLLEKRKGLLDGVAITGGEPTLQPDLSDFIANIKNRGYRVKLDTNGMLPDKLEKILAEGNVDYVAMDVKACPENYGNVTGIKNIDFSVFKKSIDIIKNSGVDFEFRTTLVKGLHSEKDVREICEIIGENCKYFLQMFVDSGDVLAARTSECEFSAFSYDEATELLKIAQSINPNTKIRGL